MDSWLKKLNDNCNKPRGDDVEPTVEADATLTCRSKKPTFNEKNEASHTKKKTYNESFLHYGFTFLSENNKHRPLCLICNEVLSTESLKPAKLKQHLHTCRVLIATGFWRFFIAYCEYPKDIKTIILFEFVNEGKYTRASFEVSLWITRGKKPYNISEELNLPAAIKMNAIVHGEEEANKMRKISLSNKYRVKAIFRNKRRSTPVTHSTN